MNPELQIAELAVAAAADAARADVLTRGLVKEAIRRRETTRPRGSLETPAATFVNEAPLLVILDQIKRPDQASILDVVGEWGGPATAARIAERLRSQWREPVLRTAAISALETLAGDRAFEVLTELSGGANDDEGEAERALDALQAIASVESSEAAEGGIMPESPTAGRLWLANRERLARTPIGLRIERLACIAASDSPRGWRASSVLAAVLTALETHLNELLVEKHEPRVAEIRAAAHPQLSRRPIFDDDAFMRSGEVSATCT